LYDETCAPTTLAVVGCFVPDNIMHWLQELKPMTKDIAAPYHSAGGCNAYRQLDLQFDGLSDLQFDQ
jgi:hypothetical protein